MEDTTAILQAMRALVAEKGSAVALAKALGISHVYLCDVLREKRPISVRMARLVGFEKVITYVKRPAP